MNKACCYIHIFYRDKKQGIGDVSKCIEMCKTRWNRFSVCCGFFWILDFWILDSVRLYGIIYRQRHNHHHHRLLYDCPSGLA